MRKFYTGVLLLKEIFYAENYAVAYRCDGLQFTIFQTEENLPIARGWAIQPGGTGGTLPHTSWSVECSQDAFREIIAREYYRFP
jgi:hypothetical protein